MTGRPALLVLAVLSTCSSAAEDPSTLRSASALQFGWDRNHEPVWRPNNEQACWKDGPTGGWPGGGPSPGEMNNALFPPECLGANPPEYCRGWGGGGCMATDCHVTVVEDSGDLAPHGQRWACGVSDCNPRPDTGRASQTLRWNFGLARVEHPHYDQCHGTEMPPCPNERDTFDYNDGCLRSSCDCNQPGDGDWDTNEFFCAGPTAFFRQDDRCNTPLDTPNCLGGANGNGGTGTLQFTTCPDRWGSFYFNTALTDSGSPLPFPGDTCDGCFMGTCNSSPGDRTCKTCKFTILPRNDCPVWDAVGDVIVNEDNGNGCNSGRLPSPPQGDAGSRRAYGTCINGFATGIGAGGWMEWPYQNSWFDCVTPDMEMFTEGGAPRIDGVSKLTKDTCVRRCQQDTCQSRALMFTLKPDQCGKATVTCTLHDDGGEAMDGCDRSEAVTFTLQVRCINDPPTFLPDTARIDIHEDPCSSSGGNNNAGSDASCYNGLYCYDNWATDIKVGPANEQHVGCSGPTCHLVQDYAFVATVPAGDEQHFTHPPSVDANGRLCFGLREHFHTSGRADIPITVVLRDTGGTDHGGVDASPPFVVQLKVRSVNDVPAFRVIEPGAHTSLEDQPAVNVVVLDSICLGGGPAAATSCADYNEAAPAVGGQTATFHVRTDTPELFAVQPTIDAAGRLSYSPAPDASGTAELEITLCDFPDGAVNPAPPDDKRCSAAQSLVVSVAAVNDPPVLTHLGDVALDEDCAAPAPHCDAASGIYRHRGWAPSAVVGPLDERDSQSLVIASVVPDDPSLFTADGQPRVVPGADGVHDLVFTPAPDASGVAVLTVTLRDSGGVENGGANTAVYTTRVTIRPVNDRPFPTRPVEDVSVWEDGAVAGGSLPVVVAKWNTFAPGPPREGDVEGQTVVSPVACVDASLPPASQPGLDAWAALFAAAPELLADGTLRATLLPDANGVAGLRCTLVDSLGLASEPFVFRFLVGAVNDAPVFNIVDPTGGSGSGFYGITECAAAEAVNGLCRRSFPVVAGSRPGPPNEAGQGMHYEVAVPAAQQHIFATRPKPYIDTTTGLLHVHMKEGGNTKAGGVDNRNNFLFFSLIDDGGTNPGVDTTTKKFLFNVADHNEPPAFDLIPAADNAYYVYEDEVAQRIRGFAVLITPGAGEDTPANFARLQFACSSADTNPATHFSGLPLLKSISVDPTSGDLVFTPNANLFGETSVTCTLNDGEPANCCASRTFLVRVTNVNDQPFFDAVNPPRIDALESSGTNIAAIATRVSAGAPNEEPPVQTLTFFTEVLSVTGSVSTAAAMFLREPTVNATGHLSFVLRDGAVGTARVRIRIKDSGGVLTTADAATLRNYASAATPGVLGADTGVWEEVDIVVRPRPYVPTFTVAAAVRTLVSHEDAVPAMREREGWATVDPPPPGASASLSQTSFEFVFTLQSVQYGTRPLVDSPPTDVASLESLLFSVRPHVKRIAAAADGGYTGDLAYEPKADAFGTAVYSVSLKAAGVASAVTVPLEVKVLAVNDAPTFRLATESVAAAEDAAAVAVVMPGFATQAVTGPENERDAQTSVAFAVETVAVVGDNLGAGLSAAARRALFFSEPPRLLGAAASRELTFLPARNVYGTAMMRVCGRDTGGVERGGVDETCKPFNITVAEVNDKPTIFPRNGTDFNVTVLQTAGKVVMERFMEVTDGELRLHPAGVSVGPADEQRTQTIVSLTAEVVDTARTRLFTSLPVLDRTHGSLTFTPNAAVYGWAAIRVTAVDSGGAATTDVFRIRILPDLQRPTFTLNPTGVVHVLSRLAAATPAAAAGPSSHTLAYAEAAARSVASGVTELSDADALELGATGAVLRPSLSFRLTARTAGGTGAGGQAFFAAPPAIDAATGTLSHRLNIGYFLEAGAPPSGSAGVQRTFDVALLRGRVDVAGGGAGAADAEFARLVSAVASENARAESAAAPTPLTVTVAPHPSLLAPMVGVAAAEATTAEDVETTLDDFVLHQQPRYAFFDYALLNRTVTCREVPPPAAASVPLLASVVHVGAGVGGAAATASSLRVVPRPDAHGATSVDCVVAVSASATPSSTLLQSAVRAPYAAVYASAGAVLDGQRYLSANDRFAMKVTAVNDPPLLTLKSWRPSDAATPPTQHLLSLLEDLPHASPQGVFRAAGLLLIAEGMLEGLGNGKNDVTVEVASAVVEGGSIVDATTVTVGKLHGDLSFRLRPGASGRAVVRLTATDLQQLKTTFDLIVDVTPVNDAPAFTAVRATLPHDTADSLVFSGAYASAITSSDPDAAPPQRLTFAATPVGATPFAAAPSVASDTGVLSYTLDPVAVAARLRAAYAAAAAPKAAPNAFEETVVVNVVLSDDGGRDNGGQDASTPAVLRIVLTDKTGKVLVAETDAPPPPPTDVPSAEASGFVLQGTVPPGVGYGAFLDAVRRDLLEYAAEKERATPMLMLPAQPTLKLVADLGPVGGVDTGAAPNAAWRSFQFEVAGATPAESAYWRDVVLQGLLFSAAEQGGAAAFANTQALVGRNAQGLGFREAGADTATPPTTPGNGATSSPESDGNATAVPAVVGRATDVDDGGLPSWVWAVAVLGGGLFVAAIAGALWWAWRQGGEDAAAAEKGAYDQAGSEAPQSPSAGGSSPLSPGYPHSPQTTNPLPNVFYSPGHDAAAVY